MKTYKVTYNRKKNKGVYAISLVENPAMEENFIALSKESNKIKLQTIDEEKRELIGVVLEPNKPIYRNQNGEEYNIVFSSEVIKDLLIGFSANGHHNSSNIEHDELLKLQDVTFFENWIVEDEENDKSNAFNLGAKRGSWVTKMKIDDDDVWDMFIKTGLIKGFSIEAMVDLDEIKLNSNMSKVELNEDSKSWIENQLDKLLDSILSPKANEKELPAVELEEVKPVELEEEEEKKEEEQIQQESGLSDEMKSEIMDMIKSVVSEMKESVDVEMKKVQDENSELKTELKKIGDQPVSRPIKSTATQVDFSKMTPYQKFREQNKKFR